MAQIEIKIVKSRKEHVCDFCTGIIKIKTDYERQTNVYDDEIYKWKAHLHCSFLANHYEMYKYCDDYGLTTEDFDEYINEIFNENYSGKYTVEEKAKFLYDKLNK